MAENGDEGGVGVVRVTHLLLGQAEVRSMGWPHNPTLVVSDGRNDSVLFRTSAAEARRLAYLLLAEAQEVAPA